MLKSPKLLWLMDQRYKWEISQRWKCHNGEIIVLMWKVSVGGTVNGVNYVVPLKGDQLFNLFENIWLKGTLMPMRVSCLEVGTQLFP